MIAYILEFIYKLIVSNLCFQTTFEVDMEWDPKTKGWLNVLFGFRRDYRFEQDFDWWTFDPFDA